MILPVYLNAITAQLFSILKKKTNSPLFMYAVPSLPPFLRERLFITDNLPEWNTDLILDDIGLISTLLDEMLGL